jgi:hypothetical protein
MTKPHDIETHRPRRNGIEAKPVLVAIVNPFCLYRPEQSGLTILGCKQALRMDLYSCCPGRIATTRADSVRSASFSARSVPGIDFLAR